MGCFVLSLLLGIGPYLPHLNDQVLLHNLYCYYEKTPSDMYQHLPRLRSLASECRSVIELGVRDMVSTWGLLQGLSDHKTGGRSYLGIDLNLPPAATFDLARNMAQRNGIGWEFVQGNDLQIDIPYTDLLFIDTLHTYAHLRYELETFSSRVGKYIVMHDTSDPYGSQDQVYDGDYSEYPDWIDVTKRGLWTAVKDFLAAHPEWEVHQRFTDCHGLTILKRVD